MKIWKSPEVAAWFPRNPEDRNKNGVTRGWVLELHNLGASPGEIASKLLIGREAVRAHLKNLGINPQVRTLPRCPHCGQPIARS